MIKQEGKFYQESSFFQFMGDLEGHTSTSGGPRVRDRCSSAKIFKLFPTLKSICEIALSLHKHTT